MSGPEKALFSGYKEHLQSKKYQLRQSENVVFLTSREKNWLIISLNTTRAAVANLPVNPCGAKTIPPDWLHIDEARQRQLVTMPGDARPRGDIF